MLPSDNGFVKITDDGKLRISARSVAEAKIAIKELKIKKREYALANGFVKITDDGKLRISARSVAEAKIAIKELKIKKREYALAKREISQQQKQIRANYTEKVRQRGSKFRGGGSVGRFVRTVQTINRDTDRRILAQELAPLEQQKTAVDVIINAIDQAILQVERFIIENR